MALKCMLSNSVAVTLRLDQLGRYGIHLTRDTNPKLAVTPGSS